MNGWIDPRSNNSIKIMRRQASRSMGRHFEAQGKLQAIERMPSAFCPSHASSESLSNSELFGIPIGASFLGGGGSGFNSSSNFVSSLRFSLVKKNLQSPGLQDL